MFEMTEEEYGFCIRVSGSTSEPELRTWFREAIPQLQAATEGFGVMAMIEADAQPFGPDERKLIEQGQATFRILGMARSAVVATRSEQLALYQQIAEAAGIERGERYFVRTAGSVEQAREWLLHGEESLAEGKSDAATDLQDAPQEVLEELDTDIRDDRSSR